MNKASSPDPAIDEPDRAAADAVPAIELVKIAKRFHSRRGVVTAVEGVDLVIGEGEFFSLLGPSGCGTTTTLRKIWPLSLPGVFVAVLLTFVPVASDCAVRRLADVRAVDRVCGHRVNNGDTQPFPLRVYGAAQRNGGNVPAQVNVMGTLIFLFGVLLALAGALSSRRKKA